MFISLLKVISVDYNQFEWNFGWTNSIFLFTTFKKMFEKFVCIYILARRNKLHLLQRHLLCLFNEATLMSNEKFKSCRDSRNDRSSRLNLPKIAFWSLITIWLKIFRILDTPLFMILSWKTSNITSFVQGG